jgi:hypothetical protein
MSLVVYCCQALLFVGRSGTLVLANQPINFAQMTEKA